MILAGKQCGKAVVGLVETSDDTQGRREFLTLESNLNHCPTGCPGLSVRVGRAMDDDKVYRLAALRWAPAKSLGEAWVAWWMSLGTKLCS